ncbi:DUF1592 domain-containing protein [Luteitalea pratensis]|uniref:DUF1592 domain-containing protein n=1 Tax=Luteitalea pratensis TaxID=1855912 RepID=UPI003AAF1887
MRAALQRETTLFVHSQLRENGHPVDCGRRTTRFRNERLARHYGIPNVTGPEFRRVNWPAQDRAGLFA